jgi:hypothetical protein
MKRFLPAIVTAVLLLLLTDLLDAAPPDWSVTTGRQNAMIVYARVVDGSGRLISSPGSVLCACENGVIVGSTPLSPGPTGTLYQMKVGSDRWESALTYRLYDGHSGRILEIGPGPGFVAGSMVGSIAAPVILRLQR